MCRAGIVPHVNHHVRGSDDDLREGYPEPTRSRSPWARPRIVSRSMGPPTYSASQGRLTGPSRTRDCTRVPDRPAAESTRAQVNRPSRGARCAAGSGGGPEPPGSASRRRTPSRGWSRRRRGAGAQAPPAVRRDGRAARTVRPSGAGTSRPGPSRAGQTRATRRPAAPAARTPGPSVPRPGRGRHRGAVASARRRSARRPRTRTRTSEARAHCPTSRRPVAPGTDQVAVPPLPSTVVGVSAARRRASSGDWRRLRRWSSTSAARSPWPERASA